MVATWASRGWTFSLATVILIGSAGGAPPKRARSVCQSGGTVAASAALTSFGRSVHTMRGEYAWDMFRQLVQKHGACNDGSLGEMWAELTTSMLNRYWQHAMSYPPLLKKAPFQDFVVRFIGSSVPIEDIANIRLAATQHCAAKAKPFCARVKEECDAALREIHDTVPNGDQRP